MLKDVAQNPGRFNIAVVLTSDVISHIRKDKKEIVYGRKGDVVTKIAESGDQVAVDNKGNKFWTYKNNVDEKGNKI